MKKGDEVKYTGSDSKGEYTLSDIDMSGWGGDETEIAVTVTVTDRAGNTQNTESSVTSNFTIIFDQTEPVSTHGIDSTGKDIVFRVSDFDNNEINLLMNISPQNATNIRAKANKKLFGEDTASSLKTNLTDIYGIV